jgi:hypothetical protein
MTLHFVSDEQKSAQSAEAYLPQAGLGEGGCQVVAPVQAGIIMLSLPVAGRRAKHLR